MAGAVRAADAVPGPFTLPLSCDCLLSKILQFMVVGLLVCLYHALCRHSSCLLHSVLREHTRCHATTPSAPDYTASLLLSHAAAYSRSLGYAKFISVDLRW